MILNRFVRFLRRRLKIQFDTDCSRIREIRSVACDFLKEQSPCDSCDSVNLCSYKTIKDV